MDKCIRFNSIARYVKDGDITYDSVSIKSEKLELKVGTKAEVTATADKAFKLIKKVKKTRLKGQTELIEYNDFVNLFMNELGRTNHSGKIQHWGDILFKNLLKKDSQKWNLITKHCIDKICESLSQGASLLTEISILHNR